MTLRAPRHTLRAAPLFAALAALTTTSVRAEEPRAGIPEEVRARLNAQAQASKVVLEAHVVRPKEKGFQIPGLVLPANAKIRQRYAFLPGLITFGGWEVKSAAPHIVTPAKTVAEGFQVTVAMAKPEMDVLLVAEGPGGKRAEEKIKLVIPPQLWEIVRRENPAPPPSLTAKEAKAEKTKRWEFSPFLGVTMLTYTQTGFEDYSATHLTLKASATYKVAPRWLALASVFANILPISESTDETLKFVGINGRVGYRIPGITGRWDLWAWTGIYYLTMTYDGQPYGFSHLYGPQVNLSAKWIATARGRLTLSGKFAPIMGFSPGSNEIAAGLAWTQITAWRPLMFSVDYATLTLDDTEESGTVGSSETVSFSFGIPL